MVGLRSQVSRAQRRMSFLLPCGQATTLESQNFGGFFTLMGFQSQLLRLGVGVQSKISRCLEDMRGGRFSRVAFATAHPSWGGAE